MIGWQIVNALMADPRARHVFKGIAPRDRLKSIRVNSRYPSAYVINLDRHDEEGSHWVACYFSGKGGEAEYFDPYGLPPNCPEIAQFIKTNSRRHKWNRRVLQSPLSKTCGLYAIYFVKKKARGYSLEKVLLPFHPYKLYYNDRRILSWAKSVQTCKQHTQGS